MRGLGWISAGVLIALMVWLWLDARTQNAAAIEPEITTPRATRVSAPLASEDLASATPDVADPALESGHEARSPAAVGHALRSGVVVEEVTDAPVRGAHLEFRFPWLDLTIVTDADRDGRFVFDPGESAAAPGLMMHGRVHDGDGILRLEAVVPLEDHIRIVVPRRSVLHGRIATQGGIPRAGLRVCTWIPRAMAGERRAFGPDTRTDEDGHFRIETSALDAGPDVFLKIASGGLPAAVRVARSELESEAGAFIEVGFCRLTISVIDERGVPIEGAIARVHHTTDVGWGENVEADLRTGTDGRVRTSVPVGLGGVQVGAPGYRSRIFGGSLPLGEETIELTLLKLDETDRLHGLVVQEDGTPVADAEVTARVNSSPGALGELTRATSRTDRNGLFVLETPPDEILVLEARHSSLGFAGPVHRLPEERATKLVLRAGTKVRIDGRGLEAESGKIAIVALHEDGTLQYVEAEALPVDLYLPYGPSDIYAVASGHWASSETKVRHTQDPRVSLQFMPFVAASGTIRAARSAAAPISLTLSPRGWPESVVHKLCRRALAADGTFRSPCPCPGDLIVRSGGMMMLRRTLEYGASLEVVLD